MDRDEEIVHTFEAENDRAAIAYWREYDFDQSYQGVFVLVQGDRLVYDDMIRDEEEEAKRKGRA